MASTVDSIIAAFRADIYPGCSAARAQTLFDEAYKRVLKDIKCRTTEVTVSWTAGVREYTLAEVNQQVNFAVCKPSAESGGWAQLEEVSLDLLSVTEPGWTADTDNTSQPTRYYITSAVNGDSADLKIGFDPVPDTTTSGGYPCVVLNVTQFSTLTGSETVPAGLLNDDPYLYYMAWKYATRQDKANALGYKAAFEEALAENQEFYQKRLVLDRNTRIVPGIVGKQGYVL